MISLFFLVKLGSATKKQQVAEPILNQLGSATKTIQVAEPIFTK